jgi:hypothetical protein
MQNAGEDAHQDAALVVVPLSSGCFMQPDEFPANTILGKLRGHEVFSEPSFRLSEYSKERVSGTAQCQLSASVRDRENGKAVNAGAQPLLEAAGAREERRP